MKRLVLTSFIAFTLVFSATAFAKTPVLDTGTPGSTSNSSTGSTTDISNVCQRAQATSGQTSPICTSQSSGNTVVNVIKDAADIIAAIAGVAAVIMIVISGFRFVVSGGSSDQVAAAKKNLIYAIVGLVVIALAWTVVTFVITKLI